MNAPLPAASELQVTAQGDREVTMLALAGELDMATTPLLDEALDRLDTRRTVILDLCDLTFIDSHGLHTLFGFAATHDVILARPHPHIARVLSLTKSERVLRIEETLDAALATGNGSRHQGG
jgi:anti-sigma B factor antagonist